MCDSESSRQKKMVVGNTHARMVFKLYEKGANRDAHIRKLIEAFRLVTVETEPFEFREGETAKSLLACKAVSE